MITFKLKQSGISGNLLNWLENYLSGRSQRVAINGSNSDWLSINTGVPQGSIRNPLLFIIFINDIVQDIDAQINFSQMILVYILL